MLAMRGMLMGWIWEYKIYRQIKYYFEFFPEATGRIKLPSTELKKMANKVGLEENLDFMFVMLGFECLLVIHISLVKDSNLVSLLNFKSSLHTFFF